MSDIIVVDEDGDTDPGDAEDGPREGDAEDGPRERLLALYDERKQLERRILEARAECEAAGESTEAAAPRATLPGGTHGPRFRSFQTVASAVGAKVRNRGE